MCSRMITFAPLAVIALLLAGCGDEASSGEDDGATAVPVYGQTLAAPEVSAYETDSETSPDAEHAIAELTLDNDALVVIWIDPGDITKVYAQHSDPEDPEGDNAWTEPNLLHTAGDGCLFVDAATDGTVVAATLGCYEGDAFIQQAPDEGQAVATADLEEWDTYSPGELFVEPKVSDGTATWKDGSTDITWTVDDGFDH